MKVCTSIAEIRAACQAATLKSAAASKGLGLVPTMGALHEGHLSLVRLARQQCHTVVVSVFVNPKQFRPQEDLASYPRTPKEDRRLLEREGTDLLFLPQAEEMYGKDFATFVQVEGLSDKLCGRSRPGHFRGVTTVVAKLLHIVEPDRAFFGQKDAAQAAIIRKMVQDLEFPVEIVTGPTVREADGLAMSSRNVYLDAKQRLEALVLYRALQRVQALAASGVESSVRLIAAAREVFAQPGGVRLDYIEIVNPANLETVENVDKGALVAAAVWVGSTRLIDNIVLAAQSR